MAKRVTTLFIRDTGIYLLAIKGDKIENWGSSPLEPGIVTQGLIVDEKQVAEKVKQLFKDTKASTKKVTIGLSGHDSLYRIMTLPELPEAVLPEAIRREVKRTIPTPLEEIYYSYQRITSAARGETRVFLVAFPRNLVDALIRTLREAGIRPVAMDLAPLALCRIPDEPRAIIVNARLDHLDVAVIADRLPQVIRRLVLPGEASSLEERLPLIGEEFNRTVAFYNSGHIDKPLDANVPVYVCGDLAEKPETWPSLVGGGGYPVSPLSSPVQIPEGMNANEFMVNIGLALRELRTEKEGANFSTVSLNALPEAYIPPRFSILRVVLPIVTIVGIGLIVAVVILIMTGRADIAVLRSEVTTLQTTVAQLQRDVAGLRAQVTSAKSAADELNSRLTTTERNWATIDEDITQIELLSRNRVTLGTINHQGGSVSVTGSATSEKQIYLYARALRDLVDAAKTPRFSSVWINSISGSEGAYSFSLSLTK